MKKVSKAKFKKFNDGLKKLSKKIIEEIKGKNDLILRGNCGYGAYDGRGKFCYSKTNKFAIGLTACEIFKYDVDKKKVIWRKPLPDMAIGIGYFHTYLGGRFEDRLVIEIYWELNDPPMILVIGWDDEDEDGNILHSESRKKPEEREGPVWVEWVQVPESMDYLDDWQLGYGILENIKDHGGIEYTPDLPVPEPEEDRDYNLNTRFDRTDGVNRRKIMKRKHN